MLRLYRVVCQWSLSPPALPPPLRQWSLLLVWTVAVAVVVPAVAGEFVATIASAAVARVVVVVHGCSVEGGSANLQTLSLSLWYRGFFHFRCRRYSRMRSDSVCCWLHLEEVVVDLPGECEIVRESQSALSHQPFLLFCDGVQACWRSRVPTVCLAAQEVPSSLARRQGLASGGRRRSGDAWSRRPAAACCLDESRILSVGRRLPDHARND